MNKIAEFVDPNQKLDSYGFKIKFLNNLNEINFSEPYHYIYKTIHFFYRPQKTKVLVIPFHGSIYKKPLPVFRGFDYEHKDIAILSLFEGLYNHYNSPEDSMFWFVDTKKYQYSKVYLEIFRFFKKKHPQHYYFGSSSGSLPALKFGLKLKSSIVISNSQLYLEKYNHYKKLVGILSAADDQIADYIDAESLVNHTGKPKDLYILNNEKDYTFPLHHSPFMEFCKKNRIKFQQWNFSRETAETRAHNFVFPEQFINILDFVTFIEAKRKENSIVYKLRTSYRKLLKR